MIIKKYLPLIIALIILVFARGMAEEAPVSVSIPGVSTPAPTTTPTTAAPTIAAPTTTPTTAKPAKPVAFTIYDRSGLYLSLLSSSYKYAEYSGGTKFMSLEGDKLGFPIGYELYNDKKNLFADFSYKSMYGRNKYYGGCSTVVNQQVISYSANSKNYEPDFYMQYQINLGTINDIANTVSNFGFYSGLGYRNLRTDSRNSTYTNPICNGSGYRRENRLLYMPFGVIMGITPVFQVKGEVDVMLSGTQDSYISDVSPSSKPLVVTNKQNDGLGFNLSAEYSFVYGNKSPFDAIVGAYLSYWEIGKSESAITYDPRDGGSVSAIEEPENKTTELGIFLKFKF